MRICIIAPSVLPILGNGQRYGGIECVVGLIGDELKAMGHEVFLMASGDSKTKGELVSTTPTALGQGSSFQKNRKANETAYRKALELNPDIIWDHTTAFHALDMRKDKSTYHFEAQMILNKRELIDTGNIPVVQTIHGPATGHMPQVAKKLSEKGQFFISISKDQKKSFDPYIRKQHVRTVYNAIDMDYYKPNHKPRENYLLWVGRFSMEKGAHIALLAARQLNIPIYLAGKINETHEKRYFNKFIKDYLGPKDKLLPLVTNKRKIELFKHASFTLMPNLWAEPFGLVAIESMATGTPVAGPSYGSLNEVVGNSGLLVKVDDLHLRENEKLISNAQLEYVDRIANIIKRSRKHYSSYSIRERTEKLFSVSTAAKNYEKAFQETIRRKKEETA